MRLVDLAATAAFVFAAACSAPPSKLASLATPPSAMPSGESWPGVYHGNLFGELHLEAGAQPGSLVGVWADGTEWGEIAGTSVGIEFHFTWTSSSISSRSGCGGEGRSSGKGYALYASTGHGGTDLNGEIGERDKDEVGLKWTATKQAVLPADIATFRNSVRASIDRRAEYESAHVLPRCSPRHTPWRK